MKPVWTYGIQLCAKQNNTNAIQRFQNKVLRIMVDVPWYVRNSDLHRDLNMDTVAIEIKRFAQGHEQRLQQNVNEEASKLLDNAGLYRRLKRTKPFELVV